MCANIYLSVVPTTLIFLTWHKCPPNPCIPQSHVSLSPTDTPISKCPYPPQPTFPEGSCYPLPSTPLWICLVLRMYSTVSNSENSLAANLLTDSNQCLVGRPWLFPNRIPLTLPKQKPQHLRTISNWTLLLIVLGSWEVGGFFPVEDAPPPPTNNLGPWGSQCFGFFCFRPPPPPYPITCTPTHVPTLSLWTVGGILVTLIPSTADSPGMVIMLASLYPPFNCGATPPSLPLQP